MKRIKQRLTRAFQLTRDLVNHLEEEDLQLKLRDLPSNTIGQQVWCLVGARESYLKAMENGAWAGFTCSLTTSKDRMAAVMALEKSQVDLLAYMETEGLGDIQKDLALDLLEHEIQHHGQLIRYVYGNGLTFPKSWNDRYTV